MALFDLIHHRLPLAAEGERHELLEPISDSG